MRAMEIHFLGGATTVTGSQFLLVTERARVLIDCGMFQGSPNESVRNRIPFAFDPAELDAVLLTHAHLDHCGLLPLLVKGYRGPIHATAGTIELATLVLLDSGKLHEEFAKREARWEKRHPDEVEADDRKRGRRVLRPPSSWRRQASDGRPRRPGAPANRRGRRSHEAVAARARRDDHRAVHEPATAERWPRDPEADLRAQPPAPRGRPRRAAVHGQGRRARRWPSSRPLRYDKEVEVAPGIHATFVDAGHILGSAIIRLRVQDREGGEERVIVFSGDLGRPGTPILRDPTMLTDADYVLVESTYGGREHEPEDEAIRILAETVRMVAEPDGVLLVPSFAIGRTQEVVWELDRLIERGEIPLLPLYLDSPMASKASDIYRRHPEYYDEETAKLLREGETPLDYPNQIVTNDVKASRAIERAPRPYMIVASNGMLTGGRVVGHLRNLIDDPNATILFVGYQGEGTLGLAPPGRRDRGQDRRPDARRSAARPARSAASRRTPTRASCSSGSAISPPASDPATPAIRAGSSSSTATPRPRSRSNRRSASWASRPTSRTGTSGSRSTKRGAASDAARPWARRRPAALRPRSTGLVARGDA